MSIKTGSSKLVVLAEQTAFLLHQQQEMKSFYQKEYDEFMALLEKKIADASSESKEHEDLSFIKKIVQEQAQQLAQEMDDDIGFLQEQLDGITKVQEINDPEREQEFEKMLLDDSHELLATQEFEQEVLKEAASSRTSMSTMLNDFKNTLEEGGGTTLARLLEAMIDEESGNGKNDDEQDREEIDMNELDPKSPMGDACCGKRDLSAGDSCCSTDGEGVDIFTLLQQASQNSENESKSGAATDPAIDIKGCCLEGEHEEKKALSECKKDLPADECCKAEKQQQESSCSSEKRSCGEQKVQSKCCSNDEPQSETEPEPENKGGCGCNCS